MSDVFKTVLLEIRPRLQCVNAFVSLIPKYNSIEIRLDNDGFLLILDKDIKKINCKGVKILINSLSSVKITDKCVSFRFLTNNSLDNIGTFKTEFLQNTVASIESLSNKPKLSTNKDYVVNCINCKNALSALIKFNRVLPLPSEGSDSSDWFCHNHGNNTEISLEPKETDVFYSQCYVHLNLNIVKNLKLSDKVVVCKFCLQWLGVKHYNNTIKLWFNTVRFYGGYSEIYTSSLDDIFQTIKSCFKYSFHNSSKLLFSCQTSSNRTDTLLLWILEKKLQILFGHSEINEYEVAKVLFKFVQINDPLIKQWENDSLVSSVDISKPMMLELITKLHKYNKLIPDEYSNSNDFKVSYLFLNDKL